MATGSQNLTTYYAKRIIGDTAAANAEQALLQIGTGVNTDTWILHKTGRVTDYGIKYHYDYTNGTTGDADQIQFVGKGSVTAWVRLDTGDLYVLGKVGIGYDPTTSGNTYKLYVNGTMYVAGATTHAATVTFANNTLNAMGDDCYIGDQNSSGAICIKGINGNTNIRFIEKDGTAAGTLTWDGSVFTLSHQLTASGGLVSPWIELISATPYIDFHFGSSTADYTSRIVESSSGYLQISGKLGIGGSSTDYKFYVNGTSYFNGNTTHNGIAYFANGTTYYINNSANGYLNSLTLKTNLNFDSTGASGTTGTSGKITWNGSTDGADIYYYVPSSDQGNLIINTRDDTNCLVAFAYNGTIKAYINNSTPCFYPATNNVGTIGTSTYEWANTYTRAICARHYDSSANYTGDRDMYYGYGSASNHYFYTNDGTTRTHRATINATGLTINQTATARNAGIIGVYDSTKVALIWCMGSSYNVKADGSSLNTLYGAAYAHTNATGALGSRTLAGGHQFLWCQNGGVNVALGNNIWTSGSVFTPTGHVWAGQYATNTAQASEYQVGVRSGAGELYMYSQAAVAGARGLYGRNAAGTYKGYLSIDKDNNVSLNGNAATATRINGNLSAATSDVDRNIWVSSTASADGIPNYISGFNMNPSTKVFTVPSGTRISPSTGALYLGNSGNQSWVYVQDMASQASADNWKITQAGVIYSKDTRGGNLRMTSNWLGFYQNANAADSRYGYIQCNADRMYFRKENGVSTYHFDFNGHIYLPTTAALYGTLGDYSSTAASDVGGLTWANRSAAASSTVNANDCPTNAWWYILRNRHTNTGNNYYTDFAIPFNDTGVYYKRIQNNAITNGWVQVLSGDMSFSFLNSGTTTRYIRFMVGDNDYAQIAAGASASNSGWMEIATADDGNEPIYVRQYTGVFSSIKRTLTLLDANGDTTIPRRLFVQSGNDVTTSNTSGALIVGDPSGENIGIDGNEIMARNSSGASTLYLNNDGGLVQVGNGGLKTAGILQASSYIYTSSYLQAETCLYLGAGQPVNMKYNNTWYNVLVNYNNSNTGVNAAGGGVYLGYSNTTLIDFMHGQATIDSSGNFSSNGKATFTNGQCNGTFLINSTAQTGPTGTGGILVIGSTTYSNLGIDGNEIQARYQSAAGTLYLNDGGGQVSIGGYVNMRAGHNDYAEYRKCNISEPGRVVAPNAFGVSQMTTERLQAGARVISDTFGFAIGYADDMKTPMAITGRVLAYPYRPISEYHIGDAVCSAPGGTVDIMTREEIKEYPERIIGIVNEIPTYGVWRVVSSDGAAKPDREPLVTETEVRGRIWIDVK